MLKTLFGIDDSQLIDNVSLHFRGGWGLAITLVVLAIAFVIYSYRAESRLSKGRRGLMGACLGLALLMLIIIILEPIAEIQTHRTSKPTLLFMVDSSSSMTIQDQRTNLEDVREAAKVMGKMKLADPLLSGDVEKMQEATGSVSRFELAKQAMLHPEIDVLKKLSDQFDVRFFSFDEKVEPEGGAEDPAAWINARKPDGSTSQLGSALNEAVARYSGQQVEGVVAISDYAWIKGTDPLKVAKDLGHRGIPIHAVTVGVPAPPDIRVREVMAPEVVFQGDKVPLRVQIESEGFQGETVELTLTIDGDRASERRIELRGGLQFEEMTFIPKKDSGSVELAFSVTSLPGETTAENNTRKSKVRILDEKINVLYVEGLPRWEYRYLRWVLLRDPRLDVTFVMTQGDPQLAATSPRHLPQFPQDIKDVMKYDLIILGDVPSSYFKPPQLDAIDQLVKKGGGSLLMLAGPMAAPTTYKDTPIEVVLPVNLGDGPWRGVSPSAHPTITDAGKESPVAALSSSVQSDARIWSQVKPLYAVPRLSGAKPGATVLLALPKSGQETKDYPLVSWQRYGTGKSLFVATEELWRMRREVGDRYHAKFWGQTIQFLTLSRLLGQNKQVSLDTERKSYSSGEQVRVFANVLTESFEPVIQNEYPLVLEQEGLQDSQVEIILSPVPDSPGLYSGVHLASGDGTYILKTKPRDLEISNQVQIEVSTIPLESRETSMRGDVARQVAELSGGSVMRLSDLSSLATKIGPREPITTVVKVEQDLWDVPFLFLLFVLFCGIEWFLRRRDNLV